MSPKTLDRLLDGAKGVNVNLSDGRVVTLARADLLSPERFRAVWEAEGCNPPPYTAEDFDDVVTALFVIATKCAEVSAL